MPRIDQAAKVIKAPAEKVYQAFKDPKAMEIWLPPKGMAGRMLLFDFREGGYYRMRLTYEGLDHPPGKTADNADEVEVRISKLASDEYIEQHVRFESDDPRFSGTMKMTWRFKSINSDTEVSVQCENVPPGINPADHQAELTASLENLADYVE